MTEQNKHLKIVDCEEKTTVGGLFHVIPQILSSHFFIRRHSSSDDSISQLHRILRKCMDRQQYPYIEHPAGIPLMPLLYIINSICALLMGLPAPVALFAPSDDAIVVAVVVWFGISCGNSVWFN